MRAVLIILGLTHFLTGPVAFFAPDFFYNTIPGVKLTGPINYHFIRDVGLAFMASGGAVVWGALNGNRAVAVAGALWPFLHALFHVQMQIMRGLPGDAAMWFDFIITIPSALIMLALAWRMSADA